MPFVSKTQFKYLSILIHKAINVDQVIGLNLFQGAMLIYSAIQVEQIQDAIHATELTSGEPLNYDPWPRIPHIL